MLDNRLMSIFKISIAAVLVVFVASTAVNAQPFSLDDTASNPKSPFSAAFRKAYADAKFGSGPPDEAKNFESLLTRFTKPEEQAELQLTLGVIYNQRTGLVDHAKSIVHMSKALEYHLSPVVLMSVYIWRGNSFELTKQKVEALKDYVRGLEICLRYDVPDKMPERPQFDKKPYIGSPSTPENDALIKEINRKMAEYRLQEKVIRQRYYYVDAIKRVLQDEHIARPQFEAIVKSVVKDRQVAGWILKRAYSANERPWK